MPGQTESSRKLLRILLLVICVFAISSQQDVFVVLGHSNISDDYRALEKDRLAGYSGEVRVEGAFPALVMDDFYGINDCGPIAAANILAYWDKNKYKGNGPWWNLDEKSRFSAWMRLLAPLQATVG